MSAGSIVRAIAVLVMAAVGLRVAWVLVQPVLIPLAVLVGGLAVASWLLHRR